MKHERTQGRARLGELPRRPDGPAAVAAAAAARLPLPWASAGSAALALALCLAGCSLEARPGAPAAAQNADPVDAQARSLEAPPLPDAPQLPGAWDSCGAARFEQLLALHLPDDGNPRQLSDPDLAALQAALDDPAPRALRAVLWIARSLDPRAYELLAVRLERRAETPERPDDAADCVAAAALGAAALGEGPLAADTAARLAALSTGPATHPDLETRTECAVAALALGRTEVRPFLLRVLRIGTPSAEREGALTDSPTTAWARGRAIEALRAELGLRQAPFTDLSAAERERIADELEHRYTAAAETAADE